MNRLFNFCFILIIVTLTACSKSDVGGKGNDKARIILAGMDNMNYPVLVEGNTKLKLDTAGKKNIIPRAIVLVGSDIFVTTTIGGYWKNGVWINLRSTCEKVDANTYLNLVHINGQDVYVAGTKRSQLGNTIDTVRIWKNGKIISQRYSRSCEFYGVLTTDPSGNIYNYNRDIYDAGGSFGSFWTIWNHALYKNNETIWSYGFRASSSPFTSIHYMDLRFEGTNTYVLDLVARYISAYTSPSSISYSWRKNYATSYLNSYTTAPSFLLTGSYIKSDSTYLSGMDQRQYVKGIYCVNGNEKVLFELPSNIAGHVGGITVKNGNIYIAGKANASSNDVYWKNNVPVQSSVPFKCLLVGVF